MYNERVMKEFAEPKNVGFIENADGVGKVGNASCGDIMEISLKIDNNVITDAKFRTFGCAAAIASSSVATQMVIGKTLDEALEIKNKDVVEHNIHHNGNAADDHRSLHPIHCPKHSHIRIGNSGKGIRNGCHRQICSPHLNTCLTGGKNPHHKLRPKSGGKQKQDGSCQRDQKGNPQHLTNIF